jgi:hypothetical protein
VSSFQSKRPPQTAFQDYLRRALPLNRLMTWLLDAMPGWVVILVLFVTVAGAVIAPRLTVYASGLVAMYLAVRLLFIMVAAVRGLRAIQNAELTDWHARYLLEATPDALAWEAVRHIVLIPNYDEPESVLCRTLSHLAQSRRSQQNMIIVLAMEAAETGSREKANRLAAMFSDHFAEIFVTVHPRGLPGESQCKSANLGWAFDWVRRELVDRRGWNAETLIVTAMDADTIWHPAYFDALTFAFATTLDRDRCFWQAPIRYHGGIHESHPLLRSINAYATVIELGYLQASWWQSLPISSYSMSMRLLERSGSWDADVIADEWHMYIKAFFAQQANVRLEAIYLPFTATAVQGASLWQTIRNRYSQTVRHAWGSKEVGYTLSNMMNQSPDTNTLRLLLSVSHDVMLSGAGWVALSVGSQLPPLLDSGLRTEYLHRPLIFPQTLLLEIALLIVAVVAVSIVAIDVRSRPPRVRKSSLSDRLLEGLSVLLMPVHVLIFVTLPLLHAQFMLLVGRSLQFKVTPK